MTPGVSIWRATSRSCTRWPSLWTRHSDDLVQETISRAHADPTADTSDAALAATLTGLAGRRQQDLESSPTPPFGDDPDAYEPEAFYPDFSSDAPDPGGWIDPPLPGVRHACCNPTTNS